ncbi:hypothetical protein GIB67_027047 [Kingdonia uniflora]|uniref:Uncharacterized protein n=1 Tax=Kingdonia uniflora TaxID=39325 RepID=A0A7J7P295_9MAGN|nr:hypothetical protein GIB67_027047 [Kingdonia uniflora]
MRILSLLKICRRRRELRERRVVRENDGRKDASLAFHYVDNSTPKKAKLSNGGKDYSSFSSVKSLIAKSKYKREKTLRDIWDYSDSSSMEKIVEGFGGHSVAKDIEDLLARHAKMVSSLPSSFIKSSPPSSRNDTLGIVNRQDPIVSHDVIVLDDGCDLLDVTRIKESVSDSKYSFGDIQGCNDGDIPMGNGKTSTSVEKSVVVIEIDSDEDDDGGGHIGSFQVSRGCKTQISIKLEMERGQGLATPTNNLFDEVKLKQFVDDEKKNAKVVQSIATCEATKQSSYSYQEVLLKKSIDENQIAKITSSEKLTTVSSEEQKTVEAKKVTNQGVYVGVEDDLDNESGQDDDGCSDLWMAMELALESSKEDAVKSSVIEHSEGEECDHSFVLKDDLGYVCRVCGVISKSIETIFDYQWVKGSKSTRTYMSTKDRDQIKVGPFSLPNGREQDLTLTEISVHPRHMKQMKPHQLQGFNFLVKNLVSDKPSGCVLAHAPGSGKTFMIFSFIQSFLAKYPSGRPLVILPKSIVGSWKKEIIKWQVEDIPLYDFYSSKANQRIQQLDILKKWVDHKGILFLGYKQFSNIVCGSLNGSLEKACHDILIKVPTILILDEGHTPRNDETDMASSLSKVQTPRKVVLSGTLFQNHVKEVFNILNLVCPMFGKSETVRAIARRIISRVQIRVGRRPPKAELDATFFELVEEALRKEEDLRQKFPVIQDLREMTTEILHYYKGDFLDELPGLVDLSVHLNLSAKQKPFLKNLEKMEKFKSSSSGSSLYMHPELMHATTVAGDNCEKRCKVGDEKIEDLLDKINYYDGVKTKFFLNMVRFCESSGEKLLVFCRYLPPLKFLEKLLVKTKGWCVGKQIFLISGDSSTEQREYSMDGFNNSPDAKVFFGSIKACGEGISLVGGSRVLILDVHLNPSVTRQAIARAFRPGQLKKVYVYRLVAADSPEEEDEYTSFRKELISKMWFEWNMYCFPQNLQMEPVDVKDCDDPFWEFSTIVEDVKVLYKRSVKVTYLLWTEADHCKYMWKSSHEEGTQSLQNKKKGTRILEERKISPLIMGDFCGT